MTNEAVPSTMKKIEYGCMKLSGYRIIVSSDIFLLDSYLDQIKIDSNFTKTMTIIGIPRKHACW